MAYQVLARKWRPQDFSSLIGQEAIVTALTNALSERRIAQAYLFSGIRGVGKTTAARLLAKSLNCVEGPTATPCNQCTPCREITAGADLDVIEVDAATYSKVEQVRELTESLRYGPARDRYKVVVLDEIHRLSRQAFDALLKIVEEPPPHLVFVFATTESEAVPATVLSRCQEFHFRRVSSDTLSRYLRKISEAEEITVSDPALHLIARAGEGSVRDSVALLDQLATFGSGEIADEDAARLVGGLDGGLLHGLLTAVLEGRSAEVSETVRRLEDEGRDPRQAYTQMLTFTRDALRLALSKPGRGDDEPRVDLPREDARALADLATGAGYENLLRLMQQLLASESMVRRSENGYLALEVAWLRAAELPKLTRVEDLLRGGPVTAPPGGGGDGGEGGPGGTGPAKGGAAGGGASRGGEESGRAARAGDDATPARAKDESDGGSSPAASPAPAEASGGPRRTAPASERDGEKATEPERRERASKPERREEANQPAPPSAPASHAAAPEVDRRTDDERAPRQDRAAADAGDADAGVADAGDADAASPPANPPSRAAAPRTGSDGAASAAGPAPDDDTTGEPPWARMDPSDPTYGEAPDGPGRGAAPGPASSPGRAPSPAAGDRRPAAADPPPSTAAFLDEVRRGKEALAAHLQEAELRFADGVLRIRHQPGDTWLTGRLSKQSNRRRVSDAVHRTWGADADWRLEEGEARPGAKETAPPDPLVDEVAEHPKVQTVLNLFDGRIDSVEERDER